MFLLLLSVEVVWPGGKMERLTLCKRGWWKRSQPSIPQTIFGHCGQEGVKWPWVRQCKHIFCFFTILALLWTNSDRKPGQFFNWCSRLKQCGQWRPTSVLGCWDIPMSNIEWDWTWLWCRSWWWNSLQPSTPHKRFSSFWHLDISWPWVRQCGQIFASVTKFILEVTFFFRKVWHRWIWCCCRPVI